MHKERHGRPQAQQKLEGVFAHSQKAVERLQSKTIWVMGDAFSSITSRDRLSITFIQHLGQNKSLGSKTSIEDEDVPAPGTLVNPENGKPLMLHFHFVAALLNDLYGIQVRSGCACAGPLSFHLV